MSYLLGIDIGTSSVKAVVIDAESGAALANAAHEYPVLQPRPGYAEQNPEDWWNAAAVTVRAAIEQSGVNRADIRAVSLSGQMHGGVCLDAASRPLRPAIIWADTRSKPQVDALMQAIPLDVLAQHAPGRPAAGFMGPTFMWLAQHEPETLKAARAVLLPKDYVRLRMTGEAATDVSDAAATWLLDVTSGTWSDWLTSQCGVDPRVLPPVLASSAVAGRLRSDAAAALNLPTGIPIIAGCADQPAQALAYSLYEPGMALVTIGTGGQVFSALRTPQIDPHLRYYAFNHAVPERWYAAASILSGGLSLRWLRDLLGWQDRPDAYAHLSALAAQTPPGADGLIFLPYLAGERTPHFDPQASGLFLGLRLHHHTGHLARAVMEGVAFALAECLALMPEKSAQVIASGGATASPVWLQIQTDVYNTPLTVTDTQHHACIGAALLAGVGCGLYASFDEACARLPQRREAAVPDAQNAAFYAERRAQFAGLYERLRDDMHLLSQS